METINIRAEHSNVSYARMSLYTPGTTADPVTIIAVLGSGGQAFLMQLPGVCYLTAMTYLSAILGEGHKNAYGEEDG